MKYHPFSEVFPLIEGAEFDALVADIKEHGLREKIWLYEGKILDGRNRFLACQKAKVKPLTRKYTGKDPLAFVVSANMQRRHLSESQRASAAAKIATLKQGQQTGKFAGMTQATAAETFGVSERSVRSAKKVHEKGSKALNDALDSGEVSVSKAASVVDLPKPQQLKAATQKPEPEADDPERPDDVDEDAALEAAEREMNASIDKVMRSDDKAAAMHDEIKRQAAEIAVLKITRDGYMRGKDAVTKMLQSEQRKVAKLEKELGKLREENEGLRERVAIMEQAA